jgi:hypothetical protein
MIDLADIPQATLQPYLDYYQASFSSLYPQSDWTIGTVLYETVIRPNAILAASQELSLEDVRSNFSLMAMAAQAEPDTDLLNSLASNYRISTLLGRPGAGELAIYTRQTGNVYIRSGALFSAGGLTMTVTKTYVGVLDDSIYADTADIEYLEMVQVGAEYVFIVPVVTTTNTAASVGEGQLVQMTNPPTQVYRVEVASAISGGSTDEQTSDLLARAQLGITARVPSGASHINSLLAQDSDFTIITPVKAFGINDPECLRDRNNAFGVSMGGRVDAYVRTAQLPSTTSVTKTATRLAGDLWTASLSASEALGCYYIASITHSASGTAITDQVDMTVTYGYEVAPAGGPEVFSALTARYSIYQNLVVQFTMAGITGATADFLFALRTMPQLTALQSYMNLADVRNEAQDVLIKAPVPCFISVDMTILRPAGDAVTADELAVLVADTVNALPTGAGQVTVEAMLQAIKAAYFELSADFPIRLEGSTYMPNGSVSTDWSCTGKLSAAVDLEQGVTARNTAFFCNSEDVSITLQDQA